MRKIWIIDVLVIGIAILTFSDLVIPPQQVHPSIWGIPYTMWVGFTMSVLIVFLTYLAKTIQKKDIDDN